MTENKRYRISQGYNDRFCHDWKKNKLFNFQQTVDLLNEQDNRIKELEIKNKQLIKEWFESEKNYIIESYHDNAIRRDEKIEFLKEEFKERFGDVDD